MADNAVQHKREGRPSKLSTELITAFKEVADEPATVALTDEELVMYVNQRLPEEKHISYSTFKNYKNREYDYITDEEKLCISEFLSTLKKVRLKQKMDTVNRMTNEGAGNWQKYAWILERKFNDLNLTRKVDHTTDGKSFNQVKILDAEEAEYTEVSEED